MSESTKLVLALVFFFVVGIFLTIFQTDTVSRVVGVLALLMSCFGVFAIWLKSHGKTLTDLSARPKISQKSREMWDSSAMPPAHKPQAELSKKTLKQLDRAVIALNSFGFFAPEALKSDMLVESIASYGEPVTLDAVLFALDETPNYHHDFDISRYDANFVFLPSKTEQLQKTIEVQVQAILALCQDDIVFSNLVVAVAGDNRVQINVDLTRAGFECAYLGSAKYLSTKPFVELAKHLHTVENTRRLACIWTDQGAYVTRIAKGALGALNQALGKSLTVNGNFSWLDEEKGFEAGSILTLTKH